MHSEACFSCTSNAAARAATAAVAAARSQEYSIIQRLRVNINSLGVEGINNPRFHLKFTSFVN